jgi:hypothetical protein
MGYKDILEVAGALAAVLTAIVAVWGYGTYRYEKVSRRRRLEQHLREEKQSGADRGQLSVLDLMAQLRMTEGDVLDAAFRSRHVRTRAPFDYGRVPLLRFEYDDDSLELEARTDPRGRKKRRF